MHRILYILLLLILLQNPGVSCQDKIVDQVVAVVGDKRVLLSDIENQFYLMISQGYKDKDKLRCRIFEDLLSQKLFINQAEIDSIEVTDVEVDMQLDRRLKFYINQLGSEEKLVAYFNKSILEIKDDMRDAIRDQILTDQIKADIIGGITATPSEVRSYYKNLPADSVPYVDAEVEISEIVIYPSTSEEAVFDVREKLLGLRQRIINGESFATLAVLYSEGPSTSKGGDIGWANKSDLDPEYAKTAFSLKKGAVSKIVKSSFGYHIIQLIDRTEDRIHTRHILMKPKIEIEAKERAINKLDSIVTLIRLDSMTFEKAAMYFSQDVDTRMNGGQVVNEITGNTKFELDNFNTRDYLVIKKLDLGEISSPYESTDKHGVTIFKVVMLKSRTNPHVANLQEDYSMLKQITMFNKQTEIVDNWIKDKIETTYIRIDDKYKYCDFRVDKWLK
jgi:peptidyl-prolyl cis-trans isomerase SurA